MKKQLVLLLISSTSFLSLAGCSNATPIEYDNSKDFEYAESNYQLFNNYEYNYYDYDNLPDSEITNCDFYVLNRYDYSEIYHDSLDHYSGELPLRIDDSKKYILDEFDYIGLDVAISPFNTSTFYASKEFTNAFDTFLNNEDFNEKVISKNELYKSALPIYKAKTIDSTFYLFDDGFVGKEYSDGIHYSSKRLSLFTSVLEYFSIRTFRGNSLDILRHGIDSNKTFTATYNNKAIEIKDFGEYFTSEEISPLSITINTKKYDITKMVDISYSDQHIYLSRDGLTISKAKYTTCYGGYKLFSLVYGDDGVTYYVTHSKCIDAEAIFELFE